MGNKVLMSDSLKAMAPDVTSDAKTDGAESQSPSVMAILTWNHDEVPTTTCGIVTSYLIDEFNELEIRMQLDEAFDIMNNMPRLEMNIQLHYDVIEHDVGQTLVAAARLCDIDTEVSMCTLAMKLQHVLGHL